MNMDRSKPKAGGRNFGGALREPYITPLTTPRPGYRVAIPKPGGGFAYRILTRATTAAPLRAARQWRDETYSQLYQSPIPTRLFHKRQSNSATGVVGVRRVIKRVKKRRADGAIGISQVAGILAVVWLMPGKNYARPTRSRSKFFSIAKWGAREALRLAALWRRHEVARLGATN
jgi:hypothetical protein